MASHMSAKIRSFVDTPKPSLDTRKLVTIDTDIKNACTELTMDTLKKLEKIADPVTYPNVARYMMMIASSSPVKCICVGISPYENGILPTFAGAMAYSPATCIGCTPSVQVLSQVMSMIAVIIKKTFVSRKRETDSYKVPSRDEYTSKFAMMLRSSYACLMAGVVFINASPVITSNTAKKVRSASIFSEWIGGMIEIHSRNQYKLTIVSMGALAESSMNDVFKSYEGAKMNVSYTKTSNPAMLQHMNVNKEQCPTPISNEITKEEMMLDEMMGNNPGSIVRSKFCWYTYSDELLLTVVKERSITQMTRLLVDETPEELLSTFLNSVLNIITNTTMDSNPLLNMISGMSLAEDTNPADNASTTSGFNPFAGMAGNTQTEEQPVNRESAPMNPFLQAINDTNTSSEARMNPGSNPNAESSQGPPMVNKRSTIGQMIDPAGKAVSHHVIVLDSMIRTLSETLTGYKDLHKDLGELMVRQANIYVKLSDNRIRSPEEVEEMNEYLESFTDFCTSTMSNMEKAYGVVSALPAVVEGDRGVYEHETQPVGPLMRRADGSTMKDYVYTEMRANAARNEQINSIMNPQTEETTEPATFNQPNANTGMTTNTSAQAPMSGMMSPNQSSNQVAPASGNTNAFNPFSAVLGIAPTQSVSTIVDLSTTGDVNMLQAAKELVYECADEFLDESPADGMDFNDTLNGFIEMNWSNQTFSGIPSDMIAIYYKIGTAKGDMSVLDCISLIVAEYMSINNGEKPSEQVMRNIFGVLNVDDEDRAGFLSMLPNWIKSTTSAMELMSMMEEDENDNADEVGGV